MPAHRKSRITLQSRSDLRRLTIRTLVPWPLPAVEAELAELTPAQAQRSQTRLRHLVAADRSWTPGFLAAAIALQVGCFMIVWESSRTWRHMGWLIAGVLAAGMAGRIFSALIARIRLLVLLNRMRREMVRGRRAAAASVSATVPDRDATLVQSNSTHRLVRLNGPTMVTSDAPRPPDSTPLPPSPAPMSVEVIVPPPAIFVERGLVLRLGDSEERVQVRLGQPRLHGSGLNWECPYEIASARYTRTRTASGEDALQCLQLALSILDEEIRRMLETTGGQLFQFDAPFRSILDHGRLATKP